MTAGEHPGKGGGLYPHFPFPQSDGAVMGELRRSLPCSSFLAPWCDVLGLAHWHWHLCPGAQAVRVGPDPCGGLRISLAASPSVTNSWLC